MGAGPRRPDREDMRRLFLIGVLAIAFGVVAQPALAGGGTYVFDGGTPKEQATVRSALNASSFDYGLVTQTITVHIGSYGGSYATAGDVYFDGSLLDAGRFSWGVVQHEFGHQVDFFLLDPAKRAVLQQALGAADWCYEGADVAHSDHGCERFASELSWAYWPSPDNCMRGPEGSAMPPAAFRALLAQLIGAPTVVAFSRKR